MKRLSGQLSLILISFFGLVIVSAGGTAWGLRLQSSDALAINLAGRQRMLIQWMTRLAEEPAPGAVDREALGAAEQAFDETLRAFRQGGAVHYPTDQLVTLPAAGDAVIQAQLTQLENGWRAFQSTLDAVRNSPPEAPESLALQTDLRAQSAALLADADLLVRQYQDAADRRIRLLGWVQAAFFTAASLLLLCGVWIARRSILHPLEALKAAAARIGAGDLDTPVETGSPLEMAALAEASDAMRRDLSAARGALLEWNRSLEARVDQRTRELEALAEVSREISARLEPQAVFQSITAKAQGLLAADSAYLCLLDADEHLLRLRSHSGASAAVRSREVDTSNPAVSTVLGCRAAQHCAGGDCLGGCGIIDDRNRRSHLAAPLWIGQRRIGALCVCSGSEAAFGAEASRLLERFAGVAAVAIENARLYRQAERLSALEERQRIAAAIHDGLAQTIDSIGLLVDRAGEQLSGDDRTAAGQTLEQAYTRIRRASNEVRQSIAGLQDDPPAPLSLQQRLGELLAAAGNCSDGAAGDPAARVQLEDAQPAGAARLEWRIHLPGALFLPEADVHNVLGITQEALANARRHSGASRICLDLAVKGSEAVLTIEDNGCGFDPQGAPDENRRHFGLKILQARAAQIGGRLEIAASPGKGTRVTLAWPPREPLPAGDY